jgi:hypothetical protein
VVWLLVLAAAGCCVALVWLGTRWRGILGGLLIVQGLYWLLGYVARPAVLLLVQPSPRFGDFLADVRLASVGYESSVFDVLRPIAVGLLTFTVCVIAFKRSTAPIPRFALPLSGRLGFSWYLLPE